jgi:CDP-diacylglycerol--glycerol-3-phosphate 3-phosphatidyltransferase
MKSIYTVPNILTACRFAIVPVLLLLLQPGRGDIVALAAFFLFLSGALTDLADGYLARKYGIESVLGKLMDPLADKMLVSTPLIMLIPMGRIPAYVSLLIISRELAVTGLRGLAAASGIVVSASGLGKIKSVFQYTALCILIFPIGLLRSHFCTIWDGSSFIFPCCLPYGQDSIISCGCRKFIWHPTATHRIFSSIDPVQEKK